MPETEAKTSVPPPPPDASTRWRMEAGELVLDIPPSGLSVEEYRLMLMVAAVLVCVGTALLLGLAFLLAAQTGVSPGVRLLWGAAFAVVCYAVPATIVLQGVFWPAFRRTRVTASPDLRVRRRLAFFRSTVEMSPGDLLELVPPAAGPLGLWRSVEGREPAVARRPPAVIARGRKTTVRFGEGLPLPELQWIHAAITKAMAS